MKVALIYLAAGNSRRFGKGNKLLWPIEGKRMYLHLLERLKRIENRHSEWELLVVTQYPEIIEEAGKSGVKTVFSPESFKGASWTVKKALEAAGAMDAYVFFVADQPYLSEKTAEEFLEYMEKSGEEGLGCFCCEERTGNPVWFAQKYVSELLELEGDSGGKKVLKKHWDDAVFFQISNERELEDVDIWDSELNQNAAINSLQLL